MNKYQFSNGLTLVHVEKPDFVKTFATVVVNYGAKDIYYNHSFPLGIAHFLEHKMFEKANEDYMELFAKLGASVNAFTSYFVTAYYFTTTQTLAKPFTMLLDLVNDLTITKESVEKEKGIITAELSMYESDPEVKMFHQLIENMYEKAPIRYDIGGNKESVNATTLEDLKTCFELFYSPNNLTICVVGSSKFDDVKKLIHNHPLSKKPIQTLPIPLQFNEQADVIKKTDILQLDVEDKILLGYKLNVIESYQLRKKMEISLNVLIALCFSSLNPDYQKWIENEYINDYFGAYVDASQFHFALIIYAESKNNAFIEQLYDILIHYEINEIMVKNIQKRLYATQVRLQDSFERYGLYLTNTVINKVEPQFELEILKNISVNDLKKAQQFLKTYSKSKLNVIKKL